MRRGKVTNHDWLFEGNSLCTCNTMPFPEKACARKCTLSAPRFGPFRLERPSRTVGLFRSTSLKRPKVTPFSLRSSSDESITEAVSSFVPLGGAQSGKGKAGLWREAPPFVFVYGGGVCPITFPGFLSQICHPAGFP